MTLIIKKYRAFTLVEMIIVLIVLGIIASIGVARIINLSKEAEEASEDAVVHSVRIGIQNYHMESLIKGRTPEYPQQLDDAPVGSHPSAATPFFSNILQDPGLTDGNWEKTGQYTYRAPSGKVYTYDNTEGTFSE